jgi:hypothetical protein
MVSRIIPQRDAIEVTVDREGTISLSQSDGSGNDDAVIYVHPSDVPRLVRFLREAAKEALSVVGPEENA